MKRLHGMVGSPGIAVGMIAHLSTETVQVGAPRSVHDNPQRQLSAAQAQVADHLHQLASELRDEDKAAEAAIFEAQALMAQDSMLTSEVLRLVEQEQLPLLEAVPHAIDGMAAILSALDDPYLRERAADVQAVGQQLIATLRGASVEVAAPAGSIVVAHDLTPAQTAGLRKTGVAGFATGSGTVTGHVAILARALGIPAVVGLGEAVLAVPDGVQAILDAERGALLVEPGADELAAYAERQAALVVERERRAGLINLPAITTDGHRIALWANIGHPDEAQQALDAGAEGIGLFRTEFLFLDRSTPPSEDEQYTAYAAAARIMAGRPVVIRTIDIGGDKPIPFLPQLHETNPFLGWRGVRFAMRFRDLFQVQLRALLRAATAGDLRIMLPMIATPTDVAWVCAELEATARVLTDEGKDFRADVPLGIMVETPAAALTLDLLASGIRFCSIGSNDLAQYTLAADRSDGELMTQYRHDDPAVWRMIRAVATDAQRLGLEISVCGELASEPQAAIGLVGLGIDKLSMTPAALPPVKEALRAVSIDEARQQARRLCRDPQ